MTPQTLLHEVLPQAVLHALGYTLLHFLWQGAVMALLVGVLLRLMHRHSAAIRYWVSWGGLMGLLLISVITFANLYASHTPSEADGAITAANGALQWETTILQTAPPTFWENAQAQGQAYLSQHLPLLVLLWLMGMLLMGLRVLGGWVYVQRLRSYRTRAVPLVWQQKAQEIAQKLGLHKMVGVAESALVQVPLVIGHFKPLVLLPLGALTGLSTAQVEAILAHELAHVHRRDYLLNLLQSLVETVFFFHPAVWWLSDCARTEREHACDDLALSLCGDSLTYAYALTNLEEMLMQPNHTSPRLAIAFSGKRRSLLSRITRLVQKSAHRPTFSEGFLASCAVIAGILVFSASAWANYSAPGVQAQTEVPVNGPAPAQAFLAADSLVVLDSLGEEQAEPTQEEDLTLQQLSDGLIIVQNKKGKVVEVYVDGRRVPKRELGKYQSRIAQQLAAAKEGKPLRDHDEVARAMERVEVSLDRLEGSSLSSLQRVDRERIELERGLAPLEGSLRRDLEIVNRHAPRPPMPRRPGAAGRNTLAPHLPVPPVAPRPNDARDSKRYKKAMKEQEVRMKNYESEMQRFEARQREFSARMQANQEGRMTEQTRRLEDHSRRLAEHDERLKDHEKRRAEHAIRMKEHEERRVKHEAMMKELLSALVADGLITSPESDYTFKLSKDGLLVNEKKQTGALFAKYKKIIQTTTGEDVDMFLKKEGSNFTIESNKTTKKAK